MENKSPRARTEVTEVKLRQPDVPLIYRIVKLFNAVKQISLSVG